MKKNLKGINSEKWHNINWKTVQDDLASKQKELVVAYRKGEGKIVNKLQLQIMTSFSSRAMAVRRVTTSGGRNTPGLDGILWDKPHKKWEAINELNINNQKEEYKPHTVKRVWIPKPGKTELRPLGIPSMKDRALQAVVVMALDPIIEDISDESSFGFRKFRGTDDAVRRIQAIISRHYGPKYIWEVDIRKCFDEISHDSVMSLLEGKLHPMGIKMIEKWLKTGIQDENLITVTVPTRGTPLGGVISPLLCNMVLNGLEEVIRGKPKPGSTEFRKNVGTWVIRYADDFVVTCHSLDKIEDELVPKVKKFLKTRGLEISQEKSRITNLKESSFEFLGWEFIMKQRNKRMNQNFFSEKSTIVVVFRPAKKAESSIKKQVSDNFVKSAPMEKIVEKLNPIIRGWINYYRISTYSKRAYDRLEKHIYETWKRWGKKTYRNKSMRWIINKCIFRTDKRKWRIGVSKEFTIVNPTELRTWNTPRLKHNKNPYVDTEYFTEWKTIKSIEKFRKAIYKKYKNKCAACDQTLYGPEMIQLHHIKERKHGGKYTLDNIVPLHETCHISITHAKKSWWEFKTN